MSRTKPDDDGLTPYERVLSRLNVVQQKGQKARAHCPVPGHEDKDASLSVSEADDGRVLVHCHGGCSQEEVVAGLGLKMRDLFPGGVEAVHSTIPLNTATPQHSRGCTLAQYAEAKWLPLDFLRSIGLSEITYQDAPTVRIPYLDPMGELAAVRYRTSLEGPERFRWKTGAKPVPYGLSRLHQARSKSYVVLLEGESDCHTLWYHHEPAIGFPGADTFREEWSSYLERIDTLYLPAEPDRGGETLRAKLAASSLRDRIRVFSLGDFKDPSALYLDDPEQFLSRWEQFKAAARPLPEVEQVEIVAARDEAWEQCQHLALSTRILDRALQCLRQIGLVGEERAAKLLYLIVTSRLLERIVSGVVKGPASAGKSHLVQCVLSLHPEEAYYTLTSVSEHALAYSKEPISHRFIVIYEVAGLNKDFASYLVRSLLSEGRVCYETVEKTRDGLRTRLITREGPTGFLATTTEVRLHPENETRLISLTVTDTHEQTKAVFMALADGEPSPPDPELLRPWHALQRWLQYSEHRVVIPYARRLAEKTPAVAVRQRRDFGALLALIRAHAVLHQATREKDHQGRMLATLDDYAAVRELVEDLMGEGIGATVSPTLRETVAKVAELCQSESTGDVSQTKLAEKLELDKSVVSRRVREAIERGYLVNREEKKGRPARLVLGDPMPAEVKLLPDPEELEEPLQCCSVDQDPQVTPLSDSEDDDEVEGEA